MGAVIRSMAVPGLGQFYSGSKLFGTGFLVGGGGTRPVYLSNGDS